MAGPAFVTAQSSQVFARTYNGIVPVAVAAPAVPAAVAPPHFHVPAPSFAAFYVPQAPALFSYAVYAPAPAVAAAVPAVPAVPAVAAAPAVVATPAAAKLVAAAPVAKVVAPVRTAPYLTTIRYRSVVV